METITLKNFGEILVSRKQAKKVFDIAEKKSFKVIFDFNGIRLITSSFADELFAKGFMKHGKAFKITNIKDQFSKNLIKQVIAGRKQLV